MIDPKPTDVGRLVIYRARHPHATPQQGTISSFNPAYVFVRFGLGSTAAACRREDLHWANPGYADKLAEAQIIDDILGAT